MVDATYPRFAEELARPPRRLAASSRAFWFLCALQGAVIAALLAILVQMLLPAAGLPLVAAADALRVRDAVLARFSGEIADPLVQAGAGDFVPASSLRGFALHGVTYYYYLEGAPGYDPLSRGIVAPEQVEVVLRDTSGPRPLVIYTLR